MRISTKGRYALAAATYMARHNNEMISVQSIAEELGISKIYLEQVFSLLKRAGLVLSVKGAQGGYRLSRLPEDINALDVLTAVEGALFEGTEDTVASTAPDIESALRRVVFEPLDAAVAACLSGATLAGLSAEAGGTATMYYI